MQDQSLRSVVSSFFFQMILFLQGASHAGKTTFAKHLARLTGASVVSLDLLKMGLIKSGNTDFSGLTPEDDEAIAERLWPIVREMAKTAIENGQNLIIEGCYLPPERVRLLLSDEVVAVYLGLSEAYLSKNFDALWKYENVVEHRKLPEDRPLEAFIAGNARVRSACAAWGLPYSRREKHTKKCRKTQSPFSTERRAWRGGNE